MKQIFIILTLLVLLLSCSNKIESEQQPEVMNLELAVGGEAVSISGDMATKAVGDDVIAIQVYQKSKESTAKYKPYCYGLWDDFSSLKLKVNKGFVYRIEATLVEDAKKYVAITDQAAMRQPFLVSGTGGDSRVQNRFMYSSTNYFSSLYQGTTTFVVGKSYNLHTRPTISRYYSDLADVVIDEDIALRLDMKRVVFGLQYQVIGFTEGTVIIELKNAPQIELTPENFGTAKNIITFQGSTFDVGDWVNDNYSELIPYSVYWKKKDGTTILIANRESNFQRKMLYNMVIDLTKTEASGNVDISKEDDNMGNGGDV